MEPITWTGIILLVVVGVLVELTTKGVSHGSSALWGRITRKPPAGADRKAEALEKGVDRPAWIRPEALPVRVSEVARHWPSAFGRPRDSRHDHPSRPRHDVRAGGLPWPRRSGDRPAAGRSLVVSTDIGAIVMDA